VKLSVHPVARRFPDEFERVTKLLNELPDLGTPTGGDRRTYPLIGFPYSGWRPSNETSRRVIPAQAGIQF